MRSILDRWLTRWGIDPRRFAALGRALVLMDLRGQHYHRATGTQPKHVISPLFWVVGQCLTVSAGASLLLFARVDALFFTWVGLTIGALVMASAIMVEFGEVVLNPDDLGVLGHRPLDARTYTAARFANLGFYFGLLFAALNLFPAVVGAGQRDVGPWFLPAYLMAALAINLLAACGVILWLASAGASAGLDKWKELLAWTQIVLVLIVFYGGQLLLRDSTHALQLWAANPPAWLAYVPTTWLADLVDTAADVTASPYRPLGALSIWLLGALAVAVLTIRRISVLHGAVRPPMVKMRFRVTPVARLGGWETPGFNWLLHGAEQRVGFRLLGVLFASDVNLRMRCLLPLAAVPALLALGAANGQFTNPLVERDPKLIFVPMLALYLVPITVPALLFHLTYVRESEAAWLLQVAPPHDPAGIAIGAAKRLMLTVIVPTVVTLALATWFLWRDPMAVSLYAGWGLVLSWPLALAALAWIVPAPPFTQSAARGVGLGPAAVPLAMLSAAMMPVAIAHGIFADRLWFWIVGGIGAATTSALLHRPVNRRFRRFAAGGAA